MPRAFLVSQVVLAAACAGHDAAPDGRDMPHVAAAVEETPPTIEDAAIATYWGGQARQITLKQGSFTGPKGERVELLRQHYVVGDLEGDGAVDTVVALRVTDAGAEDGSYIAVLRHLGTDTISLGTAPLGPHTEVRQVSLEGRRIVVAFRRLPTNGAAEDARVVFELGRGELVEVKGGV